MAKLHLLRHGETDWNLQRRWQGAQDIPLNENGMAQARDAAHKLQSLPIKAIYSSKLSRAVQTGEIIADSFQLTPTSYSELGERNVGSLEGIDIAQSYELYQDRFERFRTLSPKEQLHYKFVDDMESAMDVLNRVLPILDQIATKHKNEDVLIVTHGMVIVSLLVYHHDLSWHSTRIANCEWKTFNF